LKNKFQKFDVLVKFVDPDNLPGSFTTESYLDGYVVSLVKGPYANNWIVKLNQPIKCFDSNHGYHIADTFLVTPAGLDDKQKMLELEWCNAINQELETFAYILDPDNLPLKIEYPDDYKKYPMINAADIIIRKK